jgi:hypothetical protein
MDVGREGGRDGWMKGRKGEMDGCMHAWMKGERKEGRDRWMDGERNEGRDR